MNTKAVIAVLATYALALGGAQAQPDPCAAHAEEKQCKQEGACRWSAKPRNPKLSRKDAVHKGGEKHGQGCHMVHSYYRDHKHGHEQVSKSVEALGMHTVLEDMDCAEAFGLKDCKDINQAGDGSKCSWLCDPDDSTGTCVDQTADNKNLQQCGPAPYTGDCSECTHALYIEMNEDTNEAELFSDDNIAGDGNYFPCTYVPAGEEIIFDYGDYDEDGKGFAGDGEGNGAGPFEKSPGACFSYHDEHIVNPQGASYMKICTVSATGEAFNKGSQICGGVNIPDSYVLTNDADGFGLGRVDQESDN